MEPLSHGQNASHEQSHLTAEYSYEMHEPGNVAALTALFKASGFESRLREQCLRPPM